MRQRNFFIFFVGVIVISGLGGCKTVSHMDELLLLKALSEEQNEMRGEVELSDERFEALLEAIESKTILSYEDAISVRSVFGAPIFIERVDEEGRIYQRWLYRYSTQFFGSKKVYLYFDNAGKLIKWNSVL